MRSARYASFWLLPIVCISVGCSGGGGSGESPSSAANNLSVMVPVSAGLPLSLLAGVPTTGSIYFELPGSFDWGVFTGGDVDLDQTLTHLTIVRTDGGTSSNPTVVFSLKVAAGDDSTGACSNGMQALRAEVAGNADFSSKTAILDESTMPMAAVDIINSGAFTLCTSVTSSVDVDLTLTGFDVVFGFDGNCATSQPLAEVWTGNFTCNDVCQGAPSTEMGQVEITINQVGGTAIYQDDGGAVYVGSVCGSEFRHLGLSDGYFEYGIFTRTADTTAAKSSTWVSTVMKNCGGTCFDTLTRSR